MRDSHGTYDGRIPEPPYPMLLVPITDVTEAVNSERERCCAILIAAADQQDAKCRKAGGWYVDDGDALRDLAEEIRKGPKIEAR